MLLGSLQQFDFACIYMVNLPHDGLPAWCYDATGFNSRVGCQEWEMTVHPRGVGCGCTGWAELFSYIMVFDSGLSASRQLYNKDIIRSVSTVISPLKLWALCWLYPETVRQTVPIIPHVAHRPPPGKQQLFISAASFQNSSTTLAGK